MNKQVKCIPETRYYRFKLILISCVMFLLLIPIIGLMIRYESADETEWLLVLTLTGFSPLVAYNCYRFIYFSRLQPTDIQAVKLERVESMFRLMFFVVEMDLKGQKKSVPTLAVFASGLIGPNRIDDYSQRIVKVGYDRKRAIAVIVDC
mgnify:FL=1